MHPVRAARQVLGERIGDVSVVLLCGAAVKYVQGDYWRFESAAFLDGRIHVCRFLIRFTWGKWRWEVADYQIGEASESSEEDFFRTLSLADLFRSLITVPPGRSCCAGLSGTHLYIETPLIRGQWRTHFSQRPSENIRKVTAFEDGLRRAIADRFGQD